MALALQRFQGGVVRVRPGNAATKMARRRAAALGLTATMGRSGETRPGAGLSFGGILKGIGSVGGAVLKATTGIDLGAAFSGGGSSPALPFVGPETRGGICQPGYERDSSGRCVKTGIVGTFQRLVPGGATGTQADIMGEAVMGAFGIPAVVPMEVGSVTRNDGTVSPIRRCPRRMVLGFDDLCYPKAILTARSRFRKHRRPVRPPVTSGDVKAIRQATRAKDRVKELAMDVGWKVSKPGASRSKKKT